MIRYSFTAYFLQIIISFASYRVRNMIDVTIDRYRIVRTTLGTTEFPPSLAQCLLVCRRYLSKEVIVQLPIVLKRTFQGVQRLNIFQLAATIMVWYELNDVCFDF